MTWVGRLAGIATDKGCQPVQRGLLRRAPEQGVPQRHGDRMVCMRDLGHPTGLGHGHGRGRAATLAVKAKAGGGIGRLHEGFGQRLTVLDRLAGALSEARKHRVRSIPEQGHPTERQAVRHATVVEIVAQQCLAVRGLDETGNRGGPRAEAAQQVILLRPGDRVGVVGLARGVPVEAALAEALDTEHRAVAPVLARLDLRPLGGRHHGPPGPQTRVTRRPVADGQGSDDGVQAVGADGDVAVFGAAVGELDANAGAVLVERRAPGAEAKDLGADGLAQDGVEGRAPDHDQRRAEAGFDEVGGRPVQRPAPPVPDVGVGDPSTGRLDRRTDPETSEGVDRVRPQRDAGARPRAARGPARGRRHRYLPAVARWRP